MKLRRPDRARKYALGTNEATRNSEPRAIFKEGQREATDAVFCLERHDRLNRRPCEQERPGEQKRPGQGTHLCLDATRPPLGPVSLLLVHVPLAEEQLC